MAKTGEESELEKLIKDDLEYGMPNSSNVKVSVQDELPPITFVAVSPFFVKCEKFDDEETASCEQDPLLPASCKEYSCNGVMTNVNNVEEDEEYVPNLKIKLEADEDFCFENTVSSKYSVDEFIDTMEEVEIKCESTIDISDEKPIKLSLDKENCEDDKDELLSFKEESDIIKCESKESTFISYKQQMNLEVGVVNLNYLEKDAVMEVISTSDKVVKSGHTNLAVDESSKVKRKQNICVLKKHFTNEQNSYTCSICEKSFVLEYMLNRHMEIHSGERRFLCPVCEKSFVFKSTLNTHKQIHSGKRPFVCSICEKSFIYKYKLTQHMKIHTGERPFLCTVCEKSFVYKELLKKHMKIHSKERRFPCRVFEESFVHIDHLKQHMEVHSGNRSYL